MKDLANLLHPLPRSGEVPDDVINDACRDVQREQQEWRENWEAALDSGDLPDLDPLLGEINAARERVRTAEHQLRLLIAYGRDFARPKPYKLEDLAQASGYSVSGVRTAYGTDEVAEIIHRTGTMPRVMDTDPSGARQRLGIPVKLVGGPLDGQIRFSAPQPATGRPDRHLPVAGPIGTALNYWRLLDPDDDGGWSAQFYPGTTAPSDWILDLTTS